MVDDFWKRLKLVQFIRGKNNLRTLCEDLGIPYQTLVNEKSLHKYPSVSVLIDLSRALDCSIDWLLFGDFNVPGSGGK